MRLPWQDNQIPTEAQSDQELSSEFILGAIEDGVIMVGSDKVLHLFNRAASRISGWAANDALGLDYRSVLLFSDEHGKQQAPDSDPIAKALSSGTTVRNSKLMLRSRSNKMIPISIIVSPLEGDTDRSVVAVFRDITTEKVEEQQLSDFVSTASHEMRTPIAAIEGYLSLALNPKVSQIDERSRGYLEKAHSATDHLGQLFQDLLTSSKADDGRLSSYPVVVELGELVQQVADNARFSAQKKGLALNFNLPNQAPPSRKTIRPLYYVHVDPSRMHEVLQNLIDNAIKYTSAGSVSIAITGDDNIAQVQVSDTGQGIAEEDIPHLFQKFYRVDNSLTRAVGGTGLGLYICKKILELYNGQIWVESQVGRGSTFFINLPRLSTQTALDLQRREAVTTNPLNGSTAK